jgi:hypothetical protein
MDLNETGWEDGDQFLWLRMRTSGGLLHAVMDFRIPASKSGEFLDGLSHC